MSIFGELFGKPTKETEPGAVWTTEITKKKYRQRWQCIKCDYIYCGSPPVYRYCTPKNNVCPVCGDTRAWKVVSVREVDYSKYKNGRWQEMETKYEGDGIVEMSCLYCGQKKCGCGYADN